MILTELNTIPAATLPVDLLKQHLRLGTGFSPGDEQDELLEAYLRSAISAVESRTGVALVARDFSWELSGWRREDRQDLPVRPVQAVTNVSLINKSGAVETVAADRYVLVVTSRKVVWLFLEQLRLDFVPALHRLQGRPAAQG